TVTLVTTTPHNHFTGDQVLISNILVSGVPSNDLNGVFSITWLSPTSFQYQANANPMSRDVSRAWIGVDFYGLVSNGGRGIIVEGNRILNTTFGLYHDSFSTFDVTARNNYFSGVLAAVYEKMGGVSTATNSSTALTRNGALALFTTS